MENDRYRTILFFGPPGSGKGTQGKIFASIPGFFHISCGEVFRSLNIRSDLGRIVYEYTSSGELVPDKITVEMWKENLHTRTALGLYKPHSDLLILDGIPRNLSQAKIMDIHTEILHVIYLSCNNEDEMIARIRKRALKENRADDAREDVILQRWQIYREETQPVLDYYSSSIISEVDAVGSPAEVLQSILEIVVPIQNAHFESTTVL